jgi:DNA polymerase-1
VRLEHDGYTIRTGDEPGFESWCQRQGVMGLDVESTSLNDATGGVWSPDWRLRMVQLGSTTEAWVFDCSDPIQADRVTLALRNPDTKLVSHTSVDVLAAMVGLGVDISDRCIDTHLLSKLVDPDERSSHGLKDLCDLYLDSGLTRSQTALYDWFKSHAPKGQRAGYNYLRWGWDNIPANNVEYVVYAGLDAIYVRRLLPVMLKLNGPVAHLVEIESWLSSKVRKIEFKGLRIDREYVETFLGDVTREVAEAEQFFASELGCTSRSPQVGLALQEMGVDGSRTPTGRLQVNLEALEGWDGHPDVPAAAQDVITARLKVARASNIKSNLEGILHVAQGEYIHPKINTMQAKTSRWSVTKPAIQTYKKRDGRLRRCYITRPGHVFVKADFDQVELRVAAARSNDPVLTDVILSGADLHSETARMMFGDGFSPAERQLSKTINFAAVYGGGANAISRQGKVSIDRAREALNLWRKTYRGLANYTYRLQDLDPVVTASGRRIPPDANRRYANGNYDIQSSARDLLVHSWRLLLDVIPDDWLWMAIHDETILEVPETKVTVALEALQQSMNFDFWGIPITATAEVLGETWGSI